MSDGGALLVSMENVYAYGAKLGTAALGFHDLAGLRPRLTPRPLVTA